MRNLILISILFSGMMTFHSISYAQNILIGNWKYDGVEEFGLVTPPDSMHAKDYIEFSISENSNNYSMLFDGVNSSGKWLVNTTQKTLTFTDSDNSKSKTFNIKSVSISDLILEYQTPDLVRTRYHFTKIK